MALHDTPQATQSVEREAEVSPPRSRRRQKSWSFNREPSLWFYLLAALTVVISLFPILWLVLTSLKDTNQIYAWPIQYLPNPITFENYRYIFTQTPEMMRYIMNSFIISTSMTLVVLLVGGMAAYGVSRLNFKGANVVLLGILAVSMFPPIALIPSLFLIFRNLGLINTYPGIIIAHTALYMPLGIWILQNYFRTIPAEIEESALIDGASPFRIYWNIILPLARPGLISAGLIVFIFSWNEFPLALVLLPDNAMRTAPVGISLYPGEYSFPWETVSTAIVLAILPLLLITFVFQRYIVSGLTAGSTKG